MTETVQDRQNYVIDIIGDWLEEHDAHYLAKEGEVVWWDTITGDEEDYEWHKMATLELARVIKSCRVPLDHMHHCTGDAVIGAAQERGRAYMCGVRTTKKARSEYFNFTEHESVVHSRHYNITHSVIVWFRDNRINPEWQELKRLLRELWLEAGLFELTQIQENKYIKDVCRDLRLTAYHGNTRYLMGDKRYTCVYNKMIRPKAPVTLVFEDWMKIAIKEKLNGR